MEGKGAVANNAFNQAVGKVRQFAERVGRFTDSQKDYGNNCVRAEHSHLWMSCREYPYL